MNASNLCTELVMYVYFCINSHILAYHEFELHTKLCKLLSGGDRSYI